MFDRWFRLPQYLPKGKEAAYSTDSLLTRELHLVPTPAPSADFDRKVLDSLQNASKAPSRRLLPAWALPTIATAGVATVALLPATQAVLRTEIISVAQYVGVRDPLPFDVSPAPELAPDQQWVTSLSPLLVYDNTAKQYALEYGGWLDPARRYQDSLAWQAAEELRSVSAKWQEQPDFAAALLRHRMARTNLLDKCKTPWQFNMLYAASRQEGASHQWYMPPAPDDVVKVAALQHARHPENAFFTVANAAIAFEKGRVDEAMSLVRSLPQTRIWKDYRVEEVVARYRWERRRDSKSNRDTATLLSYGGFDNFPTSTTLGVAARASLYAAEQERSGKIAEGIAIRLALFDLAAKIAEQSSNYTTNYTDTAIAEEVTRYAADVPSARNLPVTYSNAPREVGSSKDARLKRTERAKRSLRFQAFLRNHGCVTQAAWTVQVQQMLKTKAEGLRTEADTDWVKDRVHNADSLARWNPLEVSMLHQQIGWTGLSLAALAPAIAWGVAAIIAGTWRVPFLRRREEWPVCLTLGLLIGVFSTLAIGAMQACYGVRYWNLPVQCAVLVVLVLGVGYLRLRRLRATVLCGVTACIGALLTICATDLLYLPVLRAASIWAGESVGTFDRHGWSNDYHVAIFGPLVLLAIVSLVYLAFACQRRFTWQVACQRVSRRSAQVGWGLVLVCCVWCVGLAHQEQGLESAAIASVLEHAEHGQTLLAPVGPPPVMARGNGKPLHKDL